MIFCSSFVPFLYMSPNSLYISYISESDFYFEVLGSDISISVCQRTETCSPYHDNVFTHKKQEYNKKSANTSLFTAGFLCCIVFGKYTDVLQYNITCCTAFKMKFPSYRTTNFSFLKVITGIFCHY